MLSIVGAGRRAPHDCLGFGAHLTEEAIGQARLEAAKAHQPAPHDVVGDGRAQQPDRRTHACVDRDEHSADAELFRDPRSVQRSRTAERNQGARLKIFPALDGMHTRGIRHVLVHQLADAECCMLGREL